MFNQPEAPLFKKQPFTGHDNVPAMVSLLIESMNKSPVKRSNFISIKVVHGGDRSPQYEIFKVAFKNITITVHFINNSRPNYSRFAHRQ